MIGMQTLDSLNALHSTALLQTLPISPTRFIPAAFIAVLIVIIVAAIVYMLSNVINSPRAKGWSRLQIYEALLSFLLLVVFSAIAYLFFLNPQRVYGQLNIVPQGCTSANQLFTLATCDVSQFNNAAFSLAEYSFLTSFVTGITFEPTFTYYPSKSDEGLSFSITLADIVPSDATKIMGFLFEVLVLALIFNQIQLITLSAAVFFLSVFLSLGLIARTFGFTRTFGGAMIAFGLGVGLVYPLLVSLTYGFIDVHANVVCVQSISCGLSIFKNIIAVSFDTSLLSSFSTSIGTALGNIIIQIGYIIAGLIIIPILNIAIVDAFIIDFSSSIGEKISFGTLFSEFL